MSPDNDPIKKLRQTNANKHSVSVRSEVIYPELSYRIMGAVFEVHSCLGPGFTENIYEQALALELKKRNIQFEEQKFIEVKYKDTLVGTYRLDFVIENQIILEIKAVSELTNLFKHQVTSYLCATGLRLGILVNFGSDRVQSERVVK